MTSISYEITGMTCQACVKRVQTALAPFADQVDVSLNPAMAVLKNAKVGLPDLAAALVGTHYSIHDVMPTAIAASIAKPITTSVAPSMQSRSAEISAVDVEPSLSWFVTYRPLLLILAYLLTTSVLVQLPKNGWNGVHWHETMRYFMAGFFLVFSFFKLLDLPAFADAYAGYDLLAKRWRGWGLTYPFVELALGLAYLSNWNPFVTNWVALIVMGFSAIGVIQAVFNKSSIRCACLGAVFKLPMSTVTIVEDVGMVLMAAITLWGFS